jgi:hypothetical protein
MRRKICEFVVFIVDDNTQFDIRIKSPLKGVRETWL